MGLFSALRILGTFYAAFCFRVCNTCQVATASLNTASIVATVEDQIGHSKYALLAQGLFWAKGNWVETDTKGYPLPFTEVKASPLHCPPGKPDHCRQPLTFTSLKWQLRTLAALQLLTLTICCLLRTDVLFLCLLKKKKNTLILNPPSLRNTQFLGNLSSMHGIWLLINSVCFSCYTISCYHGPSELRMKKDRDKWLFLHCTL